MAGFNKKHLSALIDQIKKGEEITSALESMKVLDIPLDIALDLELEQVLTPLAAQDAFKQSIDSILGKLAVKKETDMTIKEANMAEQAKRRRAEKKGSE